MLIFLPISIIEETSTTVHSYQLCKAESWRNKKLSQLQLTGYETCNTVSSQSILCKKAKMKHCVVALVQAKATLLLDNR